MSYVYVWAWNLHCFYNFIKTYHEDNTCECDVAGKRLSHLQNFTLQHQLCKGAESGHTISNDVIQKKNQNKTKQKTHTHTHKNFDSAHSAASFMYIAFVDWIWLTATHVTNSNMRKSEEEEETH